MNILANNMADIGAGDALIVAILGYGVVFLGLILLMAVVILVSKAIQASTKQQSEEKPAAAAAPVAEPAAPAPAAAGTAGKLKIYNVEPKTAAMIMAITADKLGKPLNELRFLSIKEVK